MEQQQVERVIAIAMDLARTGDVDELRQFIEHGLDVDVTDAEGNTLLMLASYHGHANCVAQLIELGADVDRRNNRDQAPLAGALFKGEDEVARQLIAAGADLDAGTPTPRQAADMFGRGHLLDAP